MTGSRPLRVAMLLHKSVEFDSRVRREASALAQAGHEVIVLELAGDARGTLDGFRRRSVMPPPRLRAALPFGFYRVTFVFWFIAGILAVRPDVVHAHDAAMLAPGLVGARLTGARLVYDSHELATEVPYHEWAWAWFVGTLERLITPRCAAVITVSGGIATRLRERYRLKATPLVLRNVSALAPGGGGGLRARLGLAADLPIVLHQGAPAPSRGCEVLVDAFSRTHDAHLVFLGDPEPGYGQRLAELIAAHGLQRRVSVLPSVPLSELLSYTREADVGVTLLQDNCENHRLALPNKLFEYIAAGIPVIASALPETERLVEEFGVGWTVRPDATELVAETLRRALAECRDPALQRRIRDAATVLTWSRERDRLLDLYAWLQGRRPDQLPGGS